MSTDNHGLSPGDIIKAMLARRVERDEDLSRLLGRLRQGETAEEELGTIDATIGVNVNRGLIPCPPPIGSVSSRVFWLLERLAKLESAQSAKSVDERSSECPD